MKKALIIELEKWCTDSNTQLVRYFIKNTVNSVAVYRRTGSTKELIKLFKSNIELEKFLKESAERTKEINLYNEEIRKIMLKK